MSDTTTHLGLPYLLAAQAQKHVTHNEALRLLDAMVQLSVLDRTRTSPPASPADGDRHIVASGATGLWAGWDLNIAYRVDGAWIRLVPRVGWQVWVGDEGVPLVWTGSAWQDVADRPLQVPRIGVNTTSDNTNRLSVASPATLLNHAGAGHQLKINKAAATDTASLLFQTGFSGRAEMGTAGTDGFSVTVSADGSTWHEALVADPATGSLSAPQGLRLSDGTAAAPALSFSADPDTGLYRAGADQIGAATGGVQRFLLSTTALSLTLPLLAADGTAAAPSLSFSADPDTGIYRAGGDTLGFATAGAIVGRFDSAGRFIVGPGASQNVGGQGSAQVIGAGARFGLHRFNAGAGFGPVIVLSHSRSNTVGEVVSLNSGDAIGQIQFYGASTGGAYAMGADITASVAATPSGGDMPAHIRLRTTPVGGTTPTERVRITSAGEVGIGTASPTAPLHVNGAVRVGSFTVATVPSASGMGAGAVIYVSNETGGAVPAFSDGTNWRRVTDRAIIS
jgi:hypothetical protein